MIARYIAIVGAVFLLTACASGGRWVGSGQCAKDGSAVWVEYPNTKGEYVTGNVSPENCPWYKK